MRCAQRDCPQSASMRATPKQRSTWSRIRPTHDADGLAHLAEVGFFREVRMKAFESMLTRTLVAARTRLVRITTELSNQIRGLMKTFGLLIPAGKGSTFETNVRNLLVDQDGLAPIVLPMLEAWRSMRIRAAELGRQLVAGARQSPKPSLPHSHVDPRRRRDHHDLFRHRH
jgi:transposase